MIAKCESQDSNSNSSTWRLPRFVGLVEGSKEGLLIRLLYLLRYPGGLKEVRVKKEFFTDPTRILFRAVSGMLPKNKLRKVSPTTQRPASCCLHIYMPHSETDVLVKAHNYVLILPLHV